jgi:H+/Cl- antiporter ClcA
MAAATALWLLLGLALGLLETPYQLLSELGFRLQRQLWSLPGLAGRDAFAASGWGGPLLVFAASAALLLLAWGPLAAGRGGGLGAVIALDRSGGPPELEAALLAKLSLRTQLRRLPLMLLTHLGGLTVGVESPSAALGAAFLLAIRRRWPRCRPLAALPPSLLAVIGGAAGLGAAFRSPLLAATYGLEELGRRSGIALVPTTLLLAGAGSLLTTRLGQPARLEGLTFGPLPAGLAGWALLLTALAGVLGAGLARVLIPLARWVAQGMQRRPLAGALLLAASLTAMALASGGLSLNDGSLSLSAALAGQRGGGWSAVLWRTLSTLLSIAAGAPGGLMHDTMTLGALLSAPLQGRFGLGPTELGQLAAVGATAAFAAAQGTPLFCAVFVVTLQGDAALLPVLLLVSALSAGLSAGLRGEGWNEHQAAALLAGRPGPAGGTEPRGSAAEDQP